MSTPMKPLLRLAAVLAIGFLFGSAASRGAAAGTAHGAVTATLPQVIAIDSEPCHHVEPSVWVGCDFFLTEGSIAAITVNVTTNTNKSYRLAIRTGRPDVIFLTRDAALRFLAPYYCCTADKVPELDKLRARIAAARILPR